MNEDLLSFIWKYRLYNSDLKTTNGESVTVIKPGAQNSNAGPDFFNARIKIGETVWAGNVEIHVKASDWYRHNHQTDKSYNNVILHVVYEFDSEIIVGDLTTVSTVSLSEQADISVIKKYSSLRNSRQPIPCGSNISKTDPIILKLWIDRMLTERLEYKSLHIEQSLLVNHGNWEDAFYQLLARNFGFNINSGPFEMLARNLPLNLLSKHRDQLHQLEALIFGQAGFLQNDFKDEYPVLLQKEYKFLSKKYGLIPLDHHIWKLLRMRPANFPTIRMSQFAALIATGNVSFNAIRSIEDINTLTKNFNVATSPYWNTHFLFDKVTKYNSRNLGVSSVRNILINTLAPFLFYFGKMNGEEKYCEKAFYLLQSLPAEENHILNEFTVNGIVIEDSYTSQALLSLSQNYCSQKKCLNCSLGTAILKKSIEKVS